MLVSVITPVLDEEATLHARGHELAQQEPPWEWIVVDGGSRDDSVRVASHAGATVMTAPRGRGPQLQAGAAHARGDVLLFLHADTRLPAGALSAVRGALSDPATIGGNFRLHFGEHTTAIDQFFTKYYFWQQRLFGVFYGDSVLFVRKDSYWCSGGYPDMPLMEDYELVRRLRRLGKLAWLPLCANTSSRRYRNRPIRAVALWTSIFVLYRCGVSAHHLARLYRVARDS